MHESKNNPNFLKEDRTLPINECVLQCSFLSVLFLLTFFFFFRPKMNIVLMNLLIGLAVGDIETVSNNAELQRQSMRATFITTTWAVLPNFLQRYFYKSVWFSGKAKIFTFVLLSLIVFFFFSQELIKMPNQSHTFLCCFKYRPSHRIEAAEEVEETATDRARNEIGLP